MSGAGYYGTQDYPLIMTTVGWYQMHPMLRALMQHVHTYDGQCVRQLEGADPCPDSDVCVECGNDDSAEGYSQCTECMEALE